jgi:hypothetical protein
MKQLPILVVSHRRPSGSFCIIDLYNNGNGTLKRSQGSLPRIVQHVQLEGGAEEVHKICLKW